MQPSVSGVLSVLLAGPVLNKGTLLGTPNRRPQEYSRNKVEICLPGSLDSIMFLLFLGFPV